MKRASSCASEAAPASGAADDGLAAAGSATPFNPSAAPDARAHFINKRRSSGRPACPFAKSSTSNAQSILNPSATFRLYLDERNLLNVIRAQPVVAIGRGRNVVRRAILGLQRLPLLFGALALDDLPARVVERDRISGDQQGVRIPAVLRFVARPALVHRC